MFVNLFLPELFILEDAPYYFLIQTPVEMMPANKITFSHKTHVVCGYFPACVGDLFVEPFRELGRVGDKHESHSDTER